jgi:perosamine synthetase
MEVMDSGWLTTGARTKEFERQFGEYVGSPHAVAVNSATAALHLALDALGIAGGDEVIVPTWTFAASAEVVTYLGARPVLVDVDRETLNASLETVVAGITPRTRAVIAVHFAGRPMAIRQLVTEMDRRGVSVIEDTAHAFPVRVGGRSGPMVGTIGAIGAYSFYATKTITTGEGGMLVTSNPGLADRARLMSLHGISRNAWNRYTEAGSWYYEIEAPGFKYNMTDLAAAIGLVQLSRAQELLKARRELVAAYTTRIANSEASDLLELPADEDDGSHAWHLYIVRLVLEHVTIDRAQTIEGLKKLGIGTSVHFIPLHMHPYYRREWGYRTADFPVATTEFERVISLPLWPGMSTADVDRVVAGLEQVLLPMRR